MFNALLATKEDGNHSVNVTEIDHSVLADSGVLIKVDYSTINYKDALAVTAAAPLFGSIHWSQALISPAPSKRAMIPIGPWATRLL